MTKTNHRTDPGHRRYRGNRHRRHPPQHLYFDDRTGCNRNARTRKNGAKKTGAGNSAARFAHCGQTRHGTANGRPCRAGTVIENNLTIGIFPFGGNGRTHGFGHAIRLLHIPREKASVKFPDRNPRHSESVPGISTRRISLFQQNATAPSSARELRPHRSRR